MDGVDKSMRILHTRDADMRAAGCGAPVASISATIIKERVNVCACAVANRVQHGDAIAFMTRLSLMSGPDRAHSKGGGG